jgi:hypothetical protein
VFIRTKATLTRITKEPDPKYGARQVDASMPLLQAQVRLSFCLSHELNPKPGTGGTVAGVGRYLKSMNEDVYVAIADPEGSGLFNKVTLTGTSLIIADPHSRQVKHGVMYDRKESEGTKRRHQVDTVVEGM